MKKAPIKQLLSIALVAVLLGATGWGIAWSMTDGAALVRSDGEQPISDGIHLSEYMALLGFDVRDSAEVSSDALKGIMPQSSLSQQDPRPSTESEYMLPESNTRYYSREELEALSNWELYIGHNEIYARHGREFENADLREHFAGCSWYRPLYSPEEFNAMPSMLNRYEQANADLLTIIRNERGAW